MLAHSGVLTPYATRVSIHQSSHKSETTSPKRTSPNDYELSWQIHLAAPPPFCWPLAVFLSVSMLPGWCSALSWSNLSSQLFSQGTIHVTQTHEVLLEMGIACRSGSWDYLLTVNAVKTQNTNLANFQRKFSQHWLLFYFDLISQRKW